jgi:hypothetical protein
MLGKAVPVVNAVGVANAEPSLGAKQPNPILPGQNWLFLRIVLVHDC